MKKITIAIVLLCLLGVTNMLSAQKIYNPKADAKQEISNAVKKAEKEGKHVLLQIGGNWCPWCIKMHKYLENNKEINQLMNSNYIFIVVNYSKENKNDSVMKMLGYPQRFGFPVMVVLNSEGRRLHTQNTGNLERDKGYDFRKVRNFLINWRPDALNPKNYK